jgi:hypothetical protein
MDNITPDFAPLPAITEFDQWCAARDRHEDEVQVSAQYVPRDMVGYEDLDENGSWSEVPDYGWVWRPRATPADWAPYRYGHWAWVAPWGWTWIDDAPWGFAPFHYGRWAMVAGGWVWVPGRMAVGMRPVYAPALVAFVGEPGVEVAAWFPLGPHEVYRPSYRASEVYVRRVNVTHVTVIGGANVTYVNQRIPGAVTAVSHETFVETFVSARPVGRSTIAMEGRLGHAPVVGTAAPIPPRRVSVLGNAGPAVAAPPARFVERPVVMRRPPPARVEAERVRPAPPARVERVERVEPPPARPQRVEMPAPAPRPQRVEVPAARPERPAAREERKEGRKEERKEERKVVRRGEKLDDKK